MGVGDFLKIGSLNRLGDNIYFILSEYISIFWKILDVKDGKALIVAIHAIDVRAYNDEFKEVTWSSCSLRTWLNNDFYQKAFSAEEKKRILSETVSPGNNPRYETNPGNETEDKVFLLSIGEASAAPRYSFYHGQVCCCWLRSPGYNQYGAAVIYYDGSIDYEGCSVDRTLGGVRPAMWITLNS